jgi:hypothetical protein
MTGALRAGLGFGVNVVIPSFGFFCMVHTNWQIPLREISLLFLCYCFLLSKSKTKFFYSKDHCIVALRPLVMSAATCLALASSSLYLANRCNKASSTVAGAGGAPKTDGSGGGRSSGFSGIYGSML